jgi:hypothetical protein
MKKLAAVIAFAAATIATAFLVFSPTAEAQRPQDIVWATGSGALLRPEIQIELLSVAATTTTYANNNRTAMAAFSTGTESAPTGTAVGISLTDIVGVNVILNTSSAATAGGTLQAYTYNPESGAWGRVPDLDLTAIAATNQSWPGLFVPVQRGRVTWVPNGIGTVSGVVYIVGQAK